MARIRTTALGVEVLFLDPYFNLETGTEEPEPEAPPNPYCDPLDPDAPAEWQAEVAIGWTDNNANELGHRIYRSLAPMDPANLPEPLAEVGPDVTVYKDWTVVPGGVYYYRVGAFFADGREAISAELRVDVTLEGAIKATPSDLVEPVPVLTIDTLATTDGTVTELPVVLNEGVETVAGAGGDSLAFDGTGWAETDVLTPTMVDDWSLSLWVKNQGSGASQRLLDYPGNFSVYLDDNSLWVNNYASGTFAGGTAEVPEGAWAHVVVTYASGQLGFTVNNTPAGTASVTHAAPITDSAITLGRRADTDSHYLTGALGAPRLTDYVMSASEIDTLYQAGTRPNPAISVAAQAYAGVITGEQATVTLPEGIQAGDLVLLGVSRQTALLGLDGWALVAEQADTSNAQWASLYSLRVTDTAPRYVTLSTADGSYSSLTAATMVLRAIDTTQRVGVESTAVYANADHHVPHLIAADDGRLAALLSVCDANAGYTFDYTLPAPWQQATPVSAAGNAMLMASRTVHKGEAINANLEDIAHTTTEHDGADVSALFAAMDPAQLPSETRIVDPEPEPEPEPEPDEQTAQTATLTTRQDPTVDDATAITLNATDATLDTSPVSSAALAFDGLDDYAETAALAPDIAEAWSLSLWMYRDPAGSETYQVADYPGNFAVYFHGQSAYLYLYSTNAAIRTGITLSTDVWAHLAIVYDQGQVVAFMDGTQAGTFAVQAADFTTTSPFTLGRRQAQADRYLPGRVDDVRLFRFALTYTEAGTLAQGNEPALRPAPTAATATAPVTLDFETTDWQTYVTGDWAPDNTSPTAPVSGSYALKSGPTAAGASSSAVLDLSGFDEALDITLSYRISGGTNYNEAFELYHNGVQWDYDYNVSDWYTDTLTGVRPGDHIELRYVRDAASVDAEAGENAAFADLVQIAAAASGDPAFAPTPALGTVVLAAPAVGEGGGETLAAGDYISLAVLADATVVGWGTPNYAYGQTPPADLADVAVVAAGNDFALALKNDGTVVGWGGDDYQQATPPSGLSGVVGIATGFRFAAALKNDGTVVTWGNGRNGKLAVPDDLTDVVQIALGSSHGVALRSDGTVVQFGSDQYTDFIAPGSLSAVTAVAAGSDHNLALKNDGTVVAWGGTNGSGQLDVPADLANVVAIAAGGNYSAALKSDGTVVTWGNSSLATPEGIEGITRLVGGDSHLLVRNADGYIAAWGRNNYGQSDVPYDLRIPVTHEPDVDMSTAAVGEAINGGIYLGKHTYADGREFYLIAATAEHERYQPLWGFDSVVTFATDPDDGLANQQHILALVADGVPDGGVPPEAFTYCHHHASGSKTDWYLPAINELALVQALSAAGHAEFQTNTYRRRWSSTEASGNAAHVQTFSSDTPSTTDKDYQYCYARPIRRIPV